MVSEREQKQYQHWSMTIVDREGYMPQALLVRKVADYSREYKTPKDYVMYRFLRPQVERIVGDRNLHALFRGMNGSYWYHPQTDEERQAYELGLDVWLTMSIREINPSVRIRPSDISNTATLRGFVYGFACSGRELKEYSQLTRFSTQLWEREVEEILRQCDAFGKVVPEFVEEKQKFERGLQLARAFLQ